MTKKREQKERCTISSLIIKSLNNTFKTTDEVMHLCQHWCEIPFIEDKAFKEIVKEIVKNLILNMIEFENYRVSLFFSILKKLSEEDIEELTKMTNLNVKNCIKRYSVFN